MATHESALEIKSLVGFYVIDGCVGIPKYYHN